MRSFKRLPAFRIMKKYLIVKSSCKNFFLKEETYPISFLVLSVLEIISQQIGR